MNHAEPGDRREPPLQRRLPGRREFVAFGVGAFAVAVAPRVVRGRPERVHRTVPVMGTFAEIAVVHRDRRLAQGAIDAALGELRGVDRSMTRFRPDSEIGRANRMASRTAVPVSAATASVVTAALGWADRTDGAFDPAVGRAIELWDVGSRHAPPSHDAVVRLAGQRLHRAVEVGRMDGRPVLVYHDAAVALDLGGIGKGWGVDRAVDALREWGIRNAIVNVGGDLYALGTSEQGEPWRVGIRSPDDPSKLIRTIEVSDRAVATSGVYEQYFDWHGRRFHHLLDPATGEPRRTSERTVTIA
ncbi:MAG: FAD:protein FMN transferase, partial [Gemmatimonadota bacterium]